jgi:integrase
VVQKVGAGHKKIERNPFSDGKTLILKVDNERERYLTSEEIPILLNASPTHLQHLIKCALLTGLRLGNVLNLKWNQIRDGWIYLPKTKAGKHKIPVSDGLAELFDHIKDSQGSVKGNVVDLKGKPVKSAGARSEYVFTYQGKPVKSVKTALRKACEKAGLVYGRDEPDGVTFHTLRHTHGTHLALQGAHIRTIQELLGHKSLKMTERYTKVADESKRKAVNGLDYDLS